MKPQSTCLGKENVPRNVARWSERNARVLKNISYGSTMNNTDQDQNLNIWKATGTSPGVANTAFTINHSLGRVPIVITGQITNNGGVIYGDVTTWTATQVTLKCTTASAAYRVVLA